MKSSTTIGKLKRLLLASALAAFAGLPWAIQAQPAATLGEADATWPGVKLEITKLARIDATHVAAAVRIDVGPGAPALTLIGDPPPAGLKIPANATARDIQSGKYSPIPYSLTLAKLIDEGTKAEFKAERNPPLHPAFGPNTIVTSLRPGNWIQLGVVFPCPPPPPPDANGRPVPQKAAFLLPKAKHPIVHVVLPEPAPANAGKK